MCVANSNWLFSCYFEPFQLHTFSHLFHSVQQPTSGPADLCMPKYLLVELLLLHSFSALVPATPGSKPKTISGFSSMPLKPVNMVQLLKVQSVDLCIFKIQKHFFFLWYVVKISWADTERRYSHLFTDVMNLHGIVRVRILQICGLISFTSNLLNISIV